MNNAELDRILESIPDHLTVCEIMEFTNWMAVASLRWGLAVMICGQPGLSMPHQKGSYLGDYIGKPVKVSAGELLQSDNPLRAAAGMACLNSALPVPDQLFECNAIDPFAEVVKTAPSCFIGRFQEGVDWRDAGYPVDIVEFDPGPGDIHWNKADEVLGKAEIVFITGQTLMNGTFDQVISRTPHAKIRVLMGPSVPLTPALFSSGIHVVGSTLVVDSESAFGYFLRGGGSVTHAPDGSLKKVSLACGDCCRLFSEHVIRD
ncbi:MAG: DUF364 domain-containing protein [Candidatus Wallbacteria bacterium]|nr:DUF364 domain-containing protein [Candidatus Wallbacteria bacterium]